MSEQIVVLGEAEPWSLRTRDLFEVGVVPVLRLCGTANLELLCAAISETECHFYIAAVIYIKFWKTMA